MPKLPDEHDKDFKCPDCGDELNENPDGTLPLCSCDELFGGDL